MSRRFLPAVMSVMLAASTSPAVLAASSDPQLNFKIYSPEGPASTGASSEPEADTAPVMPSESATESKPSTTSKAEEAPKAAEDTAPALSAETPMKDDGADKPAKAEAAPAEANSAFDTTPAETSKTTEAADAAPESTDAPEAKPQKATTTSEGTEGEGKSQQIASKVLQGYVRVVPTGTKIPIIMDTAVDSDTSQEGDEFEARTSEDLTIDGNIAVPAGSVIKGRIAQLNAPKHLNRSGSVALKFDTVTTPDNRQIPIVANLVARGGVVHARRGMKDIAIDTGTFALPAAAGLGIGLLAGGSSSSGSSSGGGIGRGGGAVIGAGIGCAVGLAVLLAKKGKKVDVHPGDELKIELAEDLRMPMM